MIRINSKVINGVVLVLCIVLSACSNSNNNNQITLNDGDYEWHLNTQNLQMQFSEKNTGVIVPGDSVLGLYINEEQIVRSGIIEKNMNKILLEVTTSKGEKARLEIKMLENHFCKADWKELDSLVEAA